MRDACIAVLAAFVFVTAPAVAQDKPSTDKPAAADPARLFASIVRIKAKAVANARSNPTLGREREGTGVVIDDRGHILTIGYVVIEPEAIEVTSAAGVTVPASLVGNDHASGLGIVKASAPFEAPALELGESAQLGERDPVMVLPFGGRESATFARVVSKRPFSGSWEYMLDSAIYTSPPSMTWAGAALVSREAKLVGIGSLLLRDAGGGGQGQPGNMFVPIDVLKPILAELIRDGKRSGPARPWLGLATEPLHGRLFVTRVSPDSPADKAGLKEGDIIVGIGADAVKSHSELYSRLWRLGPAGIDVPLKVLQGIDLKDVKVRSIDRLEYFRGKPVL